MQRPTFGRAGLFSIPIGVTPRRSGAALRSELTQLALTAGIVALACLGSYTLEASKARPANVPAERVCRQRFDAARDLGPVQVPICQSVDDLTVSNPAIERAIVAVHGSSRNAEQTETALEAAVGSADRQHVLIVAPQFLTPVDLAAHGLQGEVTSWRSSAWSQGDRSEIAASDDRPSSFEVLDRLVAEISRPDRYSNLKEIVIAGHSAGGQFVQRYAAGTWIERLDAIRARGINIRYVVANPSSYLYLFPREPDAMTRRCDGYDRFKYGVQDLSAYMRPLGADGLRAAYAQKDVILLLGRLDYDRLDPSMDDNCAAEAQGANRLNRGIRFVQHLDGGYGAGAHHTRVVFVAGAGHSARAMFTSPEGRAVLAGASSP
jgi:hypothetical protein